MGAFFAFFDTTILTYFLLGTMLLVIVLAVWIIQLEIRLKNLLKGRHAKSLEDSIVSLVKEQKDVAAFRAHVEQYLDLVEKRLKRSIQGVETVRFNPFKGSGGGGNQSFSTAFISEDGNGVVVSSLYARDHISVFSKPVEGFSSTFDLTTEEQQAIEAAKKNTEV